MVALASEKEDRDRLLRNLTGWVCVLSHGSHSSELGSCDVPWYGFWLGCSTRVIQNSRSSKLSDQSCTSSHFVSL